MSRILVTGSAQGLGSMAAALLVERGHRVTLHARDAQRAAHAVATVPGAEGVIVGDLATLVGMHRTAAAAGATGRFDAVVHNAGTGFADPTRTVTDDGLWTGFAVNVLAPYVLCATMRRPDRLVFLSSALHRRGHADLTDTQWRRRAWDGLQAYADTKLYDAVLAAELARRWPGVRSNAVAPGWVPTRMGGPDAPDDLALGPLTQVWLAAGDDPAADVTGGYFQHCAPRRTHEAVADPRFGAALLEHCAALSGVGPPEQRR